MKVLFVSFFVNNSHYIKSLSQSLKNNLINIEYDLLAVSDAADPDDNYLQLVEQLTGEDNYKENIKTQAIENDCLYAEIPQGIHNNHRQNHGGARHSENINYILSNIRSVVDNFDEYDFMCFIDSDVILLSQLDLKKEIEQYDMVFPAIKYNNFYYPHVGLFFINLKTVKNFSEMDASITGLDAGSNLSNFIKNNKHYKNKELDLFECNSCWTKKGTEDLWMNKKFLHIRAGSCFSSGSKIHRNEKSVNDLFERLRKISKTYDLHYWPLY